MIALATAALLAILVAWLSGARFVGDTSNGPSLAMALATAVAILSYATIIFVSSTHREEAPNVA